MYAVTLKRIMAGEQLLCMYDETSSDQDQVPLMTRSEARMALRKRLSEVAQLREELADSRAALEEHCDTAACWKRQCTKIAASAARDERKRCQKETRKVADKLGLPGVQVPTKATEAPPAEYERHFDSSEGTA